MDPESPNHGSSDESAKYFYKDFEDIDFNSPVIEENSLDREMQSRHSVLNKSFRYTKDYYTSDEEVDRGNDLPTIAHDKSIKMLDELKAVMTLRGTTSCKGSNSVNDHSHEMMNEELQTHSFENKIDKAIQVDLNEVGCCICNMEKCTQTDLMCQCLPVQVLTDKCDYLENGKKDLVKEIAEIELKLSKGENVHKEFIESNNVVIENIQTQIDQIMKKVKEFDDFIKSKELENNSCEPDHYINKRYTEQKSNVHVGRLNSEDNYCIDPSPTDQVQLNILTDSHGRGLSLMVRKLSHYKVLSLIKPNARSYEILSTNFFLNSSERKPQNMVEITVLMVGANDIYQNDTLSFLRSLKRYLCNHVHDNIIVYTIPTRYDLPYWSAVNLEIRTANNKIKDLMKRFKHLYVIDIEGLGKRFHTNHGMHLNNLGKKYICERLLIEISQIRSKSNSTRKSTIPLNWINQGN